jgi:hypothetical protein
VNGGPGTPVIDSVHPLRLKDHYKPCQNIGLRGCVAELSLCDCETFSRCRRAGGGSLGNGLFKLTGTVGGGSLGSDEVSRRAGRGVDGHDFDWQWPGDTEGAQISIMRRMETACMW